MDLLGNNPSLTLIELLMTIDPLLDNENQDQTVQNVQSDLESTLYAALLITLAKITLTLYQQQNFRPIQIESICRQQIKCC